MEGTNEIEFLLNFDFEGSGSKEAEDFLTRLIAYTGDFNDITKLTSVEVEKLQGKLGELASITKKLSDVVSTNTGVTKDNILAAQLSFQEARAAQKSIEDIIASKQKLIKTEEQLTGELNKASAMVRLYSGHLLEMDVTGKKVGEGYIKTISLLKDWAAQLESSKSALKSYNQTQEQLAGIITQTKARIAECTEQLDTFTSVEGLASKEAIALKNEIAQLNTILIDLKTQTSGQLQLEKALNDTRAANAKMTNELAAIELRNVEIKAALIIREKEYAAEVANRVNISLTGYSLEEEAALKKGIAEEEAFDKAWLLGQQWLRQQEEIYNKAWALGEEYQAKKAQAEQVTFDKAWALGQAWLKEQEIIYNKAWALGEEYQAKQAASFNKAWRDGEEWQAKQAAAAEAAEARKAAAIEKTTILYKLQTYIVRDLFRVVAATLTIIPIMALLSFIVDLTKAFFGFGEATEKAKDNIRKFNESFADSAGDIQEKFQEETQALKILIQTSADLDTSYENRVSSINKVRDAYGELLDKYTDVEIAEDKSAKTDMKKAQTLKERAEQSKEDYLRILKGISENKKKINDEQIELNEDINSPWSFLFIAQKISLKKGIELYKRQNLINEADLPSTQAEYEQNEKAYQDFIHPVNNNLKISRFKAELSELQRRNESTDYSKYGLTDKSTAEDVRRMKNTNVDYQTDTKFQIQEIRRLKDTIAELEGNKDPKGRHSQKRNVELEEARALEKARYKGAVDDINLAFEASPQSDLDKSARYDALLKAASDHADKMEAIIVKYQMKTKDSNTKLATYRQEDYDDFKRTNDEIIKEGNKDLLESQRYNDEKIKQIIETRKKLEAAADDFRKKAGENNLKQGISNREISSAKSFNPISAFFGGGAGTDAQDRKDEDKKQDEAIAQAQDNRDVAYAKLLDAKGEESKAKKIVDADNANPTPGFLEKPQAKFNREQYSKAQEERVKSEVAFQSALDKQEEAAADKTLTLEKRTQASKVALAYGAAVQLEKVAESAFSAQQKRIETTMQSLQAQYALENTLAGNNASARIRMALSEHSQMLILKREEAKSQKASSIFTAITNTAAGVTAALKLTPPYSYILAAITAAAGLVQINEIQKQPLPSYRKGRRGGKAEFAQINEEGLEVIEKRSGEKYIQPGSFAFLEEGDTVHTHQESQRYLKDIQKGVKGFEVTREGKLQAAGITKKDFQDALREELRKMPKPELVMPAQGVQDRLIRTQLRNGR